MKRIIFILAILISSITFAQNTIEKTIGEFKELKVYDLIEVKLVKSDIDKVIISGENKESVVVVNKKGTLKIRMELKEIFDGENTKVILHYTALDIIDANEGAKIHSEDTIKQFEVDLKAQEGAIIDVNLNVTYANIKAVTGGDITTTGVAKNQKATILTGGVYQGEALKTEKTEVSIKAAGEAYVNATKLVDVKIRAGGDVFIYGDPEQIKESKVLGGRVKRMK